jgi:hypothetical protein
VLYETVGQVLPDDPPEVLPVKYASAAQVNRVGEGEEFQAELPGCRRDVRLRLTDGGFFARSVFGETVPLQIG